IPDNREWQSATIPAVLPGTSWQSGSVLVLHNRYLILFLWEYSRQTDALHTEWRRYPSAASKSRILKVPLYFSCKAAGMLDTVLPSKYDAGSAWLRLPP